MRLTPTACLPFVLCTIFLTHSQLLARDLTLEDRVKAQAAVERVYYTHQIGATKPLEEALPHAVLVAKVEKYLKQSVLLEQRWKTPVTDEMLQRELERMAAGSRLPERLTELYAALGNDPFLIKECLARPALVDRLSRNFFAYDETIHGEARAQAEEIRRQFAGGCAGADVRESASLDDGIGRRVRTGGEPLAGCAGIGVGRRFADRGAVGTRPAAAVPAYP